MKKLLLGILLLTVPVWAQPPVPQPTASPAPTGPLMKTPARGPMRMNYENLDIKVLAKLVSELSGRNIVLDDRVQGKVTLLSSREMSGAEIYDLFVLALERYGYTVKSKGGYDLVLPLPDARKQAVYAQRVGNGPQPVLGLLLFKNADVTQLLTALKPLASDQNLIQAYPNAKAIVLIDKPATIRRIGELARQMGQDLEGHRAQSVNAELVEWADHILCVTQAHLQSLKRSFPEAAPKARTLGADISDPVGQSMAVYQRCAEQIEAALTRVQW